MRDNCLGGIVGIKPRQTQPESKVNVFTITKKTLFKKSGTAQRIHSIERSGGTWRKNLAFLLLGWFNRLIEIASPHHATYMVTIARPIGTKRHAIHKLE